MSAKALDASGDEIMIDDLVVFRAVNGVPAELQHRLGRVRWIVVEPEALPPEIGVAPGGCPAGYTFGVSPDALDIIARGNDDSARRALVAATDPYVAANARRR